MGLSRMLSAPATRSGLPPARKVRRPRRRLPGAARRQRGRLALLSPRLLNSVVGFVAELDTLLELRPVRWTQLSTVSAAQQNDADLEGEMNFAKRVARQPEIGLIRTLRHPSYLSRLGRQAAQPMTRRSPDAQAGPRAAADPWRCFSGRDGSDRDRDRPSLSNGIHVDGWGPC